MKAGKDVAKVAGVAGGRGKKVASGAGGGGTWGVGGRTRTLFQENLLAEPTTNYLAI